MSIFAAHFPHGVEHILATGIEAATRTATKSHGIEPFKIERA